MALRISSVSNFLTSWVVLGFPLLAVLANSLGQSSTMPSIALRGLAVGAALLLLAFAGRRNQVPLALFLIFWAVYFAQLLAASLFGAQALSRPASFYWVWGVGTSFLPALALLHTGPQARLDRLFGVLIMAGVIGCGLALLAGSTAHINAAGDLQQTGRLATESLNPISMGHLGVTTALLGLCALVSGRGRWLSVAAVFLGLAIAMQANSRGPQVALLMCVSVLLMAGGRRKRTVALGAVMALAGVYVALNLDAGALGRSASRFVAIAAGEDMSSLGRLTAYQSALELFWRSPIIGGAIEEPLTGFYPHNHVLEVLMATGLAGGIPYALLMLGAIRRAWGHMRAGSPEFWVGVLALQYIIAGMFSGAIYGSGTMWALVALMLSPALRLSKP